MEAELSELFRMVDLLGEDADKARQEMDRTKSDYSKRVYVRALFAWIEGTCFFLRRYVLSERLKHPISLDTIPEIVAMLEQTYCPDENGNVQVKDLRAPTANNLVFSLTAYAHINGLPIKIGKSGQWQNYRQALRIRDRITHPKKPQDLKIAEGEVRTVLGAQGWFVVLVQFFGPKKPRKTLA